MWNTFYEKDNECAKQKKWRKYFQLWLQFLHSCPWVYIRVEFWDRTIFRQKILSYPIFKKINNILNLKYKGLVLHEPVQYGRQQIHFSNFIVIFWEFKQSDIEHSFPITTWFFRYKYGIVMVPSLLLQHTNIPKAFGKLLRTRVSLLWIIGAQMVFSFTKGN